MGKSTAIQICGNLRRLGCRTVHIGGGEPFLNPEGLMDLLKVLVGNGLQIDYIETNAAWISDNDDRTRKILSGVVNAGGECMMVSADPFHVEFIPFWKTERLIRLLRETGISYFVWQERYLPLLRRLDPERTYSGEDLQNVFGYDVIGRCAIEYGMGFNGRALNLLRKYGKRKPTAALLQPCPELCSTGHFHTDFLGYYVPPGCTGIGMLMEDVGRKFDHEKYPVLAKLTQGGVRALLEYSMDFGYIPDPKGYVSKCELCFSIRKHIISRARQASRDLSPACFYRQDY